MKTLGFTKAILLPLMISGTIMGSSIASPTPPMGSPTSEESTSCRRENQEEQREELQASRTGSDTLEVPEELKQDISIGRDSFRREILSLHTTLGQVNYEETRQLFLHNVLTEALDDGTPKYYNSNILGRYMRKDYGNFETNTEKNS